MRNAGAARRRREPEPEEPDPVAVAVAELGRVVAASDATRQRLEGHEQAVAGIIARMGQILAAERPDPGLLAASADELSARYGLVAVELIADGAHGYEAREAAVQLTAALGTHVMMRDAWIAEGRRREAADRDARPAASGPRHARGRHLNPVPGIPTAVTRAAAAGIVAAGLTGTIAAMHEESSVRTVASAPAAARGVHRMPPDTAVLVPSTSSTPRTYEPKHAKRPSADAASASPAPTPSLPAPSAPPSPVSSSQPPAPDVPVLSVARFLDLGDSIRGELTLTAGPDAVTWTATTTDGITLSQSGGVLVPRQAVTLEVTDAPAGGGWVRISAGTETFTVHVTSGLGPVLS